MSRSCDFCGWNDPWFLIHDSKHFSGTFEILEFSLGKVLMLHLLLLLPLAEKKLFALRRVMVHHPRCCGKFVSLSAFV